MNALAPISFASAYRQLTPSERVFVDGYVHEAETAAAKAGERISLVLYREIPAEVVERSRGLLARPMVRAAISERINDIAMSSDLTTHKIERELRAIAFASIGHYMEVGEDGMPSFDLTKATPEQLSAIASMEVETKPRGGSVFKFKTYDKLRAIELLMRYTGMLEPDNAIWRADNAKPINANPLPATATPEAAADTYSRMING